MTWIILIHQIPAKPTYFRAKIWRRLQQVGAIPIKQAVYAMPDTDQCLEDLGWIAKEVNDQGGEAIILTANLVEGLTDKQVVELFKNARKPDYEKILRDAKSLTDRYHSEQATDPLLIAYKAGLRKLKKSFQAAVNIDFYPGEEQRKIDDYLNKLETKLKHPGENTLAHTPQKLDSGGYTWVTRSNVHVDRMASSWLIPRFIDRDASFKFVEVGHYSPDKKELRFDMQEAEYTHQGDKCTFEVLVQTFCSDNHELKQVAKLIHDIDLKDDSYGLEETPGIQLILKSIIANYSDDEQRIEQASTIFEGLLTSYKKKL